MGPNGLLQILCVYGRLPRFPGHDTQSTQAHKKVNVSAALADASQATFEARLNGDIRTKLLPAAIVLIRPGDKV